MKRHIIYAEDIIGNGKTLTTRIASGPTYLGHKALDMVVSLSGVKFIITPRHDAINPPSTIEAATLEEAIEIYNDN